VRWAGWLTLLVACSSGRPAGPTPPSPEDALRATALAQCQPLMNHHIDTATTCQEAQAGINDEPSCRAAYQRPVNLGCKR
jgi:hypothetical protein